MGEGAVLTCGVRGGSRHDREIIRESTVSEGITGAPHSSAEQEAESSARTPQATPLNPTSTREPLCPKGLADFKEAPPFGDQVSKEMNL